MATPWKAKGDVVSTDMRAFNNHGGNIGLTGFGPNINVVKDPRYGRNSELPGEVSTPAGSRFRPPCDLKKLSAYRIRC